MNDNLTFLNDINFSEYRSQFTTSPKNNTHINLENRSLKRKTVGDEIDLLFKDGELKKFKPHKLLCLQLNEIRKQSPLKACVVIQLIKNELNGLSFDENVEVIPKVNFAKALEAYKEISNFLGIQSNSLNAQLANNAIGISGLGRPIQIVVSDSKISFIQVESLMVFRFKKDSTGSYSSKNSYVLAIDGKVEKFVDVIKILKFIKQEEKPLIIISRGYSQEIIDGIEQNNLAGNFEVTLLSIDPNHPFDLADFSRITNSMLVQTFDFINNQSLGYIEDAEIDVKGLVKIGLKSEDIELQARCQALKSELEKLPSKNIGNPLAKEKYVSERIRRISGNEKIEINVGLDDLSDGLVDISLLSALINAWSDIITQPSVINHDFKNLPKILPYQTFKDSLRLASQLYQNMRDAKVWLEIPNLVG